MATADSVKTKLTNLIAKANTATGGSDADLTSAVDTLIAGYGTGSDAPSGTITITENGTHDVAAYASAQVNVPAGITPSGTLNITANGTHDVTNYVNAAVNITGLNARIFTATLAADTTGEAVFLTNDWLKNIRSNSNAFVLLRYMGMAASTAAVNTVLTANFPLYYGGATLYNSIVLRSTASVGNANPNTNGLSGGAQYNGHLMIDANGRLYCYGNATYPIKAGTYQIIAGLVESL